MSNTIRGTWAVLLLLALHGPAAAQSARASGSLGAGSFASDPAALVDVSAGIAGEEYALGVGARLRFLEGQGLRDRDWDERSELFTLLRYAVYQHDGEILGISAVAGELSGATFGRGALLSEYGTGVNADHHRLGAQLKLSTDAWRADALIDDVADARILGGRVAIDFGRFQLGGQVMTDRAMPDGDGTRALVLAALDGEVGATTADERLSGSLYVSHVALFGLGTGIHLGARAGYEVPETLRVGLFGEARVGSSGYVPRWFGPLYEVERASRIAVAESGMAGGFGAAAGFEIEAPAFGTVRAIYDERAGLEDQVMVTLLLPQFARMQFGAWAAWEFAALEQDMALAAELRLLLPAELFGTVEVARLYQDEEGGMLVPFWSAMASVGRAFGD